MELVFFFISAEIAIRQLVGAQRFDGIIHAFSQTLIAGKAPGVGRCMQIFSDVFSNPPLNPRPVFKRFQNRIQVQLEKPFLNIDLHAIMKPAHVACFLKISRFEGDIHFVLNGGLDGVCEGGGHGVSWMLVVR